VRRQRQAVRYAGLFILEKIANGCSVATANTKMIVKAASRMFSAIFVSASSAGWRPSNQRDHPVDEAFARLLA